MPNGAEAGDLEPTLEQLYQEMFSNNLFMNTLVVRKGRGLVEKLGKARLPVIIQPVSVYTTTPVSPKDQIKGMTLKEFREAGGRIVAHGVEHAPRYKDYEDEDIAAVRWMLQDCPVDGPSNSYYFMPLDMGMPSIGVLRGRKLVLPNRELVLQKVGEQI